MKIILDGYNVIHGIPELLAKLDKSLQDARTALAMHMSTWKWKNRYSEILIIFDGQDGVAERPFNTKLCGIDCAFARTKEKADNLIVSIVRSAKDASKITVVSDDNYVRNNCRALGAEVEHASFLQSPPKKRARASDEVRKNIMVKTAQSITSEYEKYLRENGII